MKKVVILTFLFSLYFTVRSQTIIWTEDFDGYANGVVVGANNNTDNPANDWTSGGCTTCPLATDDYWEVRSGVFEARDVNEELVNLTTESIDISAFASVDFEVTISEVGDLEGLYRGANDADCIDQTNEDFANVEYRIDGGAWILVSNYLGWCGFYASCGIHTLYGDDATSGDCRMTDDDWESTTVKISGLSGSTLELRMSCTVSSGAERIRLDDIVVESTPIVLPIVLTDFSATVNNNSVVLEWETASEINNDYFTIEKSSDGETFFKVGVIDGAGNSYKNIKYKFIDVQPLEGESYYRLTQTDFDGKQESFKLKVVEFRSPSSKSLNIYPNPSNNFINLEGNIDGTSCILIYDMKGNKIFEQCQFDKEVTQVIDIVALNKGVYFLHVGKESLRFIKN